MRLHPSTRLHQVFSILWQAVSFLFIVILLPNQLILVGVTGSLIGVFLAIVAVLRGRSSWAAISLFDAFLMFFVLLFSQVASGIVGQYLEVTLLLLIMLLFGVELLTTTVDSANAEDQQRAAQQAFRHITRSALLFSTCYILALGTLYVGAFISSTAFLLTDVSLYIVVVSISLALLLVLREESEEA